VTDYLTAKFSRVAISAAGQQNISLADVERYAGKIFPKFGQMLRYVPCAATILLRRKSISVVVVFRSSMPKYALPQ